MSTQSVIPITFEKSHLATIGSRLYSESLDLVRELVANAYDADATRVKVTVADDRMVVEDNGEGMDRDGLVQYFIIGSTFKRTHAISPKFKRVRIGEFGIGKFAVLALCDRFELFTGKDGAAHTVVFDRLDFEQKSSWEVPVLEHESHLGHGTTVTLIGLRRPPAPDQLERKLRHQLPLSQPHFSVSLNGVELRPHYTPGRRFRIRDQAEYGPINGEIILSSLLLPAELSGIGLRVKGVEVRRDYFGLDRGKTLSARRLTGEIAADWLPLTAARDAVMKDTPEYRAFSLIIDKHIKRISRELGRLKETRRDIKADQALSNALLKVRQALRRNKDFLFTHDLPLFTPQKEAELADVLGGRTQTASAGRRPKPEKPRANSLPGRITRKMDKKTRNLVKTVLKDKKRLVKKLKIGGVSIVCSLARMGEAEAESFSESGIIFINRDHPLYTQVAGDDDLAAYHLARLITQELVLLARPAGAEQAYEWQSRLLSDALRE